MALTEKCCGSCAKFLYEGMAGNGIRCDRLKDSAAVHCSDRPGDNDCSARYKTPELDRGECVMGDSDRDELKESARLWQMERREFTDRISQLETESRERQIKADYASKEQQRELDVARYQIEMLQKENNKARGYTRGLEFGRGRLADGGHEDQPKNPASYQQGWVCPKCGAVWSPNYTGACPCSMKVNC